MEYIYGSEENWKDIDDFRKIVDYDYAPCRSGERDVSLFEWREKKM